MESTITRPSSGAAVTWIARGIIVLVVAFWLMDAVSHIVKPGPVVDAFVRQGVPLQMAPIIGILQLVLLAVYLTPRLSVLGIVLETGYLGGAVAINARADSPLFEILFPVIFAVLVWAPVYLRNERLRAIFPVIR
jgi:DoxX-like protein